MSKSKGEFLTVSLLEEKGYDPLVYRFFGRCSGRCPPVFGTAKNFAEADRIRDELKAQGIEITDLPGGASWKRV